MRTVNVHEAKTHFSRLIDAAHAGETIVVAKGGKPWALLVPLEKPAPLRQPGVLAGILSLPPAEVLLDALNAATDVVEDMDMKYHHWPPKLTTVQVPFAPRNSFVSQALEMFGRPARDGCKGGKVPGKTAVPPAAKGQAPSLVLLLPLRARARTA